MKKKSKALFYYLLIGIIFCNCNNSTTSENNDKSLHKENSNKHTRDKANSDSILDIQNPQNLVKENNDSVINTTQTAVVNTKDAKLKTKNDIKIEDLIIQCTKK
ncbi:MAG: hypothetical protein AAGI07_07905 [Bacteroidota bacterium]